MKGIILAGGLGTRLLPITRQVNKHLVPILSKPMVMFPISTLKSLGVKDIMIVSGGGHMGGFTDFFRDGSEFGIDLTYRVQKDAGGIAQALGVASDFADGERVAVILGDNVFDNKDIIKHFNPEERPDMAHIFAKKVPDPERFGVITWEAGGDGKFTIEEKPANPQTGLAVTGLYIYPGDVFDIIPKLKPSARGELEITDVNNYFVNRDNCILHVIDGFWSDAGTPESLYKAIKFVAKNEGYEE